MLNYMEELQERFLPVPDHAEELAKIEQIFNELKPALECNGARLRCLLDIEKKLRENVAEENFAAGFALSWEIRKELQDTKYKPKSRAVCKKHLPPRGYSVLSLGRAMVYRGPA